MLLFIVAVDSLVLPLLTVVLPLLLFHLFLLSSSSSSVVFQRPCLARVEGLEH